MPHRVKEVRGRLEDDFREEFFREQVSRLRKAVRDALDSEAALYEPRDFGKKPRTRYGFALPAAAIAVTGRPA
jgi:hypothetical protein